MSKSVGTSLEYAAPAAVTGAKAGVHATRLIPAILVLAAMSFAWHVFGLTQQPIVNDYWFDADTTVMYSTITDIHGYHSHRTRKHPIFSLMLFPVVNTLAFAGFEKATAVRLIFSAIPGLWTLLLYSILARQLKRPDAVVFTLLGLSSSAFLFWSWPSETYALSSVTILLAIFTFHRRSRSGIFLQFAASLTTLGVTVTNWSAALLSSLMSLPRRKAVAVAALAFIIVTILALVQARTLKTQGFFLNVRDQARAEKAFVNHTASGSVIDRWRMLLIGSVIVPGVDWRLVDIYDYRRNRPMLSSQTVEGNGLWWAGASIWTILLCAGTLAALRGRTQFSIYILILASFHFILHTFYGYETFLYSMHIVPVLVLLAAQSVHLHRRGALFCAGSVIILAAVHNWILLQRAIGLLRTVPG